MAHHPKILRVTTIVKASYWYPDGEAPLANDCQTGSSDIRSCSDSSAKLIDSTLFTHLICAFADVDPNHYKVYIPCKNEDKFSTFTSIVKEKNSQVQTLLSIGGKNTENSVFASMASTSANRKAFIDSSITIARDNKFSGLDLAWEYPSNDVEMSNFGKLLEEWRKAVKDESDESDRLPLLLSAAVYYSSEYKSVSYPVEEIKENLDWVNIRAFDFYGPGWSSVTGPPAALFDHSDSSAPSGASGLKNWIDAGLPVTKAVLGLSYVAWAWSLQDDSENGYHAPTTGAALSPDGSINYAQVRDYIVNNGAAVVHSATVTGDYCYAGDTWIGYDDFQSVVRKINYAKYEKLYGYFAWHVGADYKCGLSRAASRAWDNYVEPSTEVPIITEEE